MVPPLFRQASQLVPYDVRSHTQRDIGRTRLSLLDRSFGKRLGKVFGEGARSLAPTGCSLKGGIPLTLFRHCLDHIGVMSIYSTGSQKCQAPNSPESLPSESPKNARLPLLIFRRTCGTLMVRGMPRGESAAGTPAVLVMSPIRTHIFYKGRLPPAVNCRPPSASLPCAGARRTLEAAKRRGGDPPAICAGYNRVHTALAEAAFKAWSAAFSETVGECGACLPVRGALLSPRLRPRRRGAP